jgi:hypothetical protein
MSLSAAGGSTIAITAAGKSAHFEMTAGGLSAGTVLPVKGKYP